MKKIIKIFPFLIVFTIFLVNTYAANVSVNNVEFDSLIDALVSANDGDTIEILSDLEEAQAINIDKGITINGNDKSITFNSLTNTNNAGFVIQTSNKITFNNLNIISNKRGIALDSQEHHLDINNCKISVTQRGITINNSNTVNSSINVNDSIIEISGLSNYNEELGVADTRGISLWEFKDSSLNISNSTIQGFFYDLNIGGGDGINAYDCGNTKISITNTNFKGRAGINNWSKVNDITLKNCDIAGINNFSGSSESFADIVLNKTGSTINIYDTAFTNFENETGLNNPNALQFMLSIRGNDNAVNIFGDTTFLDTTQKISSPFDIDVSNNNSKINISSGKYSYSVKEFLTDKYTEINENNMYIVGLKATDISVLDSIDLNLGESKKLDITVSPENVIEELSLTSSNESVVAINEDNFLQPKAVGKSVITIKVGNIEKTCNVNVYPINLLGDVNFQNLENTENLNIETNTFDIINASILSNPDLRDKVKEEILLNKEISIDFDMQTIENQEEFTNIEKLISNNLENSVTLGKLLDINILVKSNGEIISNVNDLNEKIEFNINVPEDLIKENRNFGVVRIHGNEVTLLDSTYNNGILTLKSDRFSLYALVYTDSLNTDINTATNDENINDSLENKATNDKLEKIQTGDFLITTAVIIISILLFTIVLLQLLKNKIRVNHEKK